MISPVHQHHLQKAAKIGHSKIVTVVMAQPNMANLYESECNMVRKRVEYDHVK